MGELFGTSSRTAKISLAAAPTAQRIPILSTPGRCGRERHVLALMISTMKPKERYMLRTAEVRRQWRYSTKTTAPIATAARQESPAAAKASPDRNSSSGTADQKPTDIASRMKRTAAGTCVAWTQGVRKFDQVGRLGQKRRGNTMT